MTKVTASGIIVFRNNFNKPEVLGLIALPKHRRRTGGKYDVPKGSIDSGESAYKAAKRECFEECGLRPKLISKEPIVFGSISLWVGYVDIDDSVIIGSNPVTGEVEHEGYEWIPISKLKSECLRYLKSHIIAAEKIIWEYFKI